MSKFKVSSSKSSILSYPTAKPELSLDFVNTPEGIDPAYSFTRNSAATYVGPDGFIKTAAVNQPRFDFDPATGESLGLLVEEARTNVLKYSNDFSQTGSWQFVQATPTYNASTAPDGTQTATRLTTAATTSTQYITSIGTNTVAAGAQTVSAYVKPGTCTQLQLQFNGNINTRICFDLATDSTFNIQANGSNGIGTITNVGNGWKRIVLTSTVAATDTVSIYLLQNQGFILSAGLTLEVWGFQAETGSFPTSYIPTTTTTVTRQPDQLVLNKTLNTQGTLYVESRPTTGVPLVADNGSSPLSVSQNLNQYSKSVLYYNTDRTLTMSSDGNEPVDYSSFLALQDLNRVSLGFDRLSNSSYINGHLKKFSYYSSPLTEDNLRALTGNKRSITRFPSLGEPIVTSGLVLNLDAGNPASYPGSGTTWFDLSGFGNNGTLVNGVGYDGNITVDGVDDYVLMGRIPFTGTSTVSVSWGLWVYPQSTNGNIMSMSNANPQGSWNMPPIAANGQRFRGKIWPNNFLFSSIYTLNRWYYLTLVWNYSTNSSERGQFFYMDGVLQASQTNINYSSSGTDNFIFLGQSNPGADNTGMFLGKYGMFHIYGNKALTAAEIQQNFNATRNRFGI